MIKQGYIQKSNFIEKETDDDLSSSQIVKQASDVTISHENSTIVSSLDDE